MKSIHLEPEAVTAASHFGINRPASAASRLIRFDGLPLLRGEPLRERGDS